MCDDLVSKAAEYSAGFILHFMENVTVAVNGYNPGLPSTFSLSQNYPNPFNPASTVEFRIQSSEFVTLKVYDVLGREVSTQVNEVKEPGTYTVEFDAAGLAGGVYFYCLTAGDFVQTRKLLLLR